MYLFDSLGCDYETYDPMPNADYMTLITWQSLGGSTSLMHNAWNSMAFVIVRDMAGEESICRKPMPLRGARPPCNLG